MEPHPLRALSTRTPSELEYQAYYAGPSSFNVASTLISGAKKAVLVDAQFTLAEGARLAQWVAASKKELEAIFITHAHPDHHFGLQSVLERFPSVPVFATPSVVDEARATHASKVRQWRAVLGADITSQPVLPLPYREATFDLEGHSIEILRLEGSDARHAAALWTPSSKTLVAGDAVFDGCHAWLADADAEQRQEWIMALVRLQRLGAQRVIPGHRGARSMERPDSIQRTIDYILAFGNAVKSGLDAPGLIDAMTTAFPSHELPQILEAAARKWALSPRPS